ncbi:MAG: GNAT family N-acetyltransferase [Clostridiaceae bacterium]|nr:GNAT family N-acetyltransferase [Clostridiaceae bacterium]
MDHSKVFEVRLAKPEDAPKIREITQEAFTKYCELAGIDNIEALNETVEDVINDIKTKLCFVAYIGEEIVGSVRVEVFDDKTAYLSRFGVSTKYQNLGIGKAIMNLVDVTMRTMEVKRICLHTASKVSSLIRFYYGRGFYIDSTTKDRGYIRALLCKDYS